MEPEAANRSHNARLKPIEGGQFAEEARISTRQRFSPTAQLVGLAVLAGVVLANAAVITYRSWHGASRSRLILGWALGIVVLAMLAREAARLLRNRRARRASSAP